MSEKPTALHADFAVGLGNLGDPIADILDIYAGYDVLKTASFEEAQDLIQNRGLKPVLAVLGNKITNFGDGAKMIELLKENSPGTFILFLSSFDAERMRAKLLGADVTWNRAGQRIEEWIELAQEALNRNP